MNDEQARLFRLGYAPAGWDGLLRLLARAGVPAELAEEAGLLIRRDEDSTGPPTSATVRSHYDRFRDRLIFPVLTSHGPIAFGARVLPGAEEGAKYINSPESPLYKKGEQLYGLHQARESIRKSRSVVLVEGNFDVLALQQRGLGQTVAPMGTALTEHQVGQLKRLLGEDGFVVLMLDGDRAGRAATLKDIARFSAAAMDVRVVALPEGEDPDTYSAKVADPTTLLVEARPAVDFVLEQAVRRGQHDTVAGKLAVLEEVGPLCQSFQGRPLEYSLYVGKLAGALALPDSQVREHLRSYRAGQAPPPAPTPPPTPATAEAVDPLELKLLGLCADHPQLLPLLQDWVLGRLHHLGELLSEARDLAQGGEVLSAARLVDLAPPELRDPVARAVGRGEFVGVEVPEQALMDLMRALLGAALDREGCEIERDLRQAETDRDRERVRSLSTRYQNLLAERHVLLSPAS